MLSPYSETRTWSIWPVERPAATMASIWCRTAMAVDAFDCATEMSVHDGQRTVASIAAARADAEGGPESKTPLPTTSATASTARGSVTRAHSGSRAGRSAI